MTKNAIYQRARAAKPPPPRALSMTKNAICRRAWRAAKRKREADEDEGA